MSHTIRQVKEQNQQSDSNSFQASQDSLKPEDEKTESFSSLSDADYEFLFNQLLEGIGHGWHDHRIIKFFNQLGDRGKQEDWVAWLERLRVKVLTLPIKSKRPLGTMMIRLGELTQATPQVNQIGIVAHRIGRELLFGDTEDIIWEYDGPDQILESLTNSISLETEQELSERLPTDFAALSSLATDEEDSINFIDITTEPDTTTPELAVVETTDISNQEQSKPVAESPTIAEESLEAISSTTSNSATTDLSSTTDITTPEPELEVFNLEQLMSLIQQDEELAQQIAQKLNVSLVNVPSPPQKPVKQPQIKELTEIEQSSIELIESWFNLGLKQVGAGEFEKAIASWEKALQINPNLSEAWHNRGSALGRLGKYQEAVNSFENALVIDNDNYQAWNDRAHALYQLQNWTEAINSWNNAIKIMPGNHLFWYHRGCAFEQLEYWDKAIESYEKSLEIKPDFEPARSRYINLVADNSRSN